MITQLELEEGWMVELHPKGGSQFRQVRDVMREHLQMMMDGKKPEWIAVAIRPDFDSAQKELSRIRREIREKKKNERETNAD